MKRKSVLFELQSSTGLKTSPIPRNLQRKIQKSSSTTFLKTRKKMPFSLSTNTERQTLLSRGQLRKSSLRKQNLKVWRYCTFEGDVTRDDSQQRPLAQQSVATLSPHCFERLQHCSNIPALCCAKNRRCESSRVKSRWGSGSLKGSS